MEGAIATIATRKDNHTSTEKGEDCFFHVYKLLIFKCFDFERNIRNITPLC